MASNVEFVEYVCEQIGGAGEISYKKMFGDYAVYCGKKVVGLICDNRFFVKKTQGGANCYPGCAEDSPYSGAKPHFVPDRIDERDFMAEFIRVTYDCLPEPKPKVKKSRQEKRTTLRTARLVLRPWKISDATDLFECARDESIGPIAGWPPHKSVKESRDVIKTVFCGSECYAVCEQNSDSPIGCIELKLNGHTDMTNRDDECEMGFWISKQFRGCGLIPEAARELLRRAFEDLGMRTVWCGYYDGNEKSKRAQEKIGFVFHHTCESVDVPLLGETRVGHTNYMTRELWNDLQKQNAM